MTTKTNKTNKICPIGKKLFFLCAISFHSSGLFPNRVGSEAVINSRPSFFDEWAYNYRQQDNSDGRLGHNILTVRSGKSFRVWPLTECLCCAEEPRSPKLAKSISRTV